MYNKLFSKILDSSLWLEDHATVRVFITFLASMNQDGFAAYASPANLAHRARVSPDECAAALKVLEGPDLTSPGQDFEGRRVERVPGGWMVLNAAKYKDIVTTEHQRTLTRERVRRHRAKGDVTGDVTQSGNATVTQSDTEADTEVGTTTTVDEAFDRFWAAYPRRSGSNPKRDAMKCWHARLGEGHTVEVIMAGLERFGAWVVAADRQGSEFVMQAKRFLGPSLPFLERWDLPKQNGNGKKQHFDYTPSTEAPPWAR